MVDGAITADTSYNGLVTNRSVDDPHEKRSKNTTMLSELRLIPKRDWATVAVLCFVNLINYMDRYTVAGILTNIQHDFNIGNDKSGLLQTAFIISYMIFAPLFGYMGDRYNRKVIMALGVFLWSLTTFIGSYMKTFEWFLLFRALVGIGEASYSTIAPTIISDLFVKDVRSQMLALFYFAIPVGSGLGYITGGETAKAIGEWQWGLRITPVLGIVAIILLLTIVRDPVRGEREGGARLVVTSWTEDIKALIRNPSFMLSTGGFTCVAFVTGALGWWATAFMQLGFALNGNAGSIDAEDVAYKFGLIGMTSGLIGVPLGSALAQKLRVRWHQADPLICAAGLLVSAPILFFATITVNTNTNLCYTLIFFGQVTLNLNWAIVADMLLYVVMPTRRSTAEAFQILVAHAFGDAGSPYLIGVISEILKTVLVPDLSIGNAAHTTISPIRNETRVTTPEEDIVNFRSLQYALFVTMFVEVLGSLFFLLTALHIQKDKALVDRTIAGGTVSDSAHIYNDDAESESQEDSQRP